MIFPLSELLLIGSWKNADNQTDKIRSAVTVDKHVSRLKLHEITNRTAQARINNRLIDNKVEWNSSVFEGK